jgi:ABC-type sugar transport system ATPase subunit
MNESTVSIRGLKKTYPGGTLALQRIDLDIPAGMFGLLGPNGAGKSTLMKILATLLEPDEGTARLNNLDILLFFAFIGAAATAAGLVVWLLYRSVSNRAGRDHDT